jgi:8-oxo-dGTP pyrophosphatase MutT (NUDIX family)
LSAFTWPPDPSSQASPDRPSPPASPPPPGGALPTGAPPLPTAGEPIPAAVLVPLFIGGEHTEPHVVLTKRRADLRRHAGEISFPGGRRDAEDADFEATALREAEEEIGLARTGVRMIGTLPATATFATSYVIHPFVAEIPAGLAWSLSAREVETVLELPLARVRAGLRRVPIERRGITFETDAYVVDEHTIWGATARILSHLFERLQPAAEGGRLSLAGPEGPEPSPLASPDGPGRP